MKITRIGSEKNLHTKIDVLDIELNNKRYRLTESPDGKLNIQGVEKLIIHPCVSNVIEVESIE